MRCINYRRSEVVIPTTPAKMYCMSTWLVSHLTFIFTNIHFGWCCVIIQTEVNPLVEGDYASIKSNEVAVSNKFGISFS